MHKIYCLCILMIPAFWLFVAITLYSYKFAAIKNIFHSISSSELNIFKSYTCELYLMYCMVHTFLAVYKLLRWKFREDWENINSENKVKNVESPITFLHKGIFRKMTSLNILFAVGQSNGIILVGIHFREIIPLNRQEGTKNLILISFEGLPIVQRMGGRPG
jgi:hypothetical protein